MLIDLLIGLREGLIIVLLKLFLFINNIVSWFVFKRKKHKNKKKASRYGYLHLIHENA